MKPETLQRLNTWTAIDMAVKAAIRKEKTVSREELVKGAVVAGKPVLVKRRDVEEMIDLSLPDLASGKRKAMATTKVKKQRTQKYYWE